MRHVLESQGGHGPVTRAAGVLGGQHAARLGMQLLAVGLGDRVVHGVADHLVPEPVLTGPGGLQEAGVAPGGQRVGQLARRHSGHRGQHVPPEARAQDCGGLE